MAGDLSKMHFDEAYNYLTKDNENIQQEFF